MEPTTLCYVLNFVVLSFASLVYLSNCVSVPKKEPVYITAVVGEPALLPCYTDLNTPVVWMFQSDQRDPVDEISFDGQFANGHAKHFLLDTALAGDHNLVIKSVNMTSAGMYTCDEDNGIGTRHTIHLNVTGAYPGQFDISAGEAIRLPCHITSRIVEDLMWYYKPLSARHPEDVSDSWSLVSRSTSKFYVDDQSKVGRYDLVLRDAEMSDSGFYRCKSPGNYIIRNLSVTDSNSRVSTPVSTTDYPDSGRNTLSIGGTVVGIVIVIVVAVVLLPANIFFLIRHCCQNKHKKDDGTNVSLLHNTDELKRTVYEIISTDATTASHGDKYVFRLTKHPKVFAACIKKMAKHLKRKGKPMKAVIGLNGHDTRGELLASRIAGELGLPFVEMTESIAPSDQDSGVVYTSELTGETYTVSMSQDVSTLGREVVIVDNAVVTGATMRAATHLATEKGLTVVQRIGLMKLPADPRQITPDNNRRQATSEDFDWMMFDFQPA